jgi:hypothetical protein
MPINVEALTKTTTQARAAMEILLKPRIVMPVESMIFDQQSRYVDWHFDRTDFETLDILHLTDIQYGHPACRVERFIEHLKWIVKKTNRFFVLGGDCIDASHALSKGHGVGQKEPQVQVLEFCHLIAPYAHRCLGFVGGNHERRSMPMFGDLGRLISHLIGVPYSPGKQYVNLFFGDHKPFKIGLFHGASGGQTKGAIANQVYRWMTQGDCHYYLLGHLHQAMVIPDNRERHDIENRCMVNEKIIGAMSTSFLDHYGTYGEVAGYKNPGKSLMARCIIERNGKWEVTLR